MKSASPAPGATSATPPSSGPSNVSGRPWLRWRHSLRLRLVLLFLLLGLAIAAVFVSGIRKGFNQGWENAVRPLAMDYVDRLAAEIGSPPDVVRAQALAQKLPIAIHISGPVTNWDSQPQRERRFGPRNERDASLFTRQTADGHRIVFRLSFPGARADGPPPILWYTLAALLLLTALAYWRVHRMLLPLQGISAGARRFGTGDFATPIATGNDRGADELTTLAQDVNGMADNLRHMLDARRDLLLAVSHELRSPLTRARLNMELLPEPDDAEARAAHSALLRDLALMRDLIQDLLESERLSNPHALLQREPTDLALLARSAVAEMARAQPAAAAIAVNADSQLPLLDLDRTRMQLLLRNLLDNALRHSPPGTAPTVSISRDEGHKVVLEVRDYGNGVPETQLPHLAQAFYRPDSARQRSSGGVGLGLYLCRLVAEAHGGQFAIRNANPGLAVRITLPINS